MDTKPDSMLAAAHAICLSGSFKLEAVQQCLSYFRRRFVRDGQFALEFHQLRLRPRDHRSLIRSVLSGSIDTPAGVVAALLIITWKIRRTLFTDDSWIEHAGEQLPCLSQISSFLIYVLSFACSSGAANTKSH